MKKLQSTTGRSVNAQTIIRDFKQGYTPRGIARHRKVSQLKVIELLQHHKTITDKQAEKMRASINR